MATSTTIILGGGVGGLVTAHELRRRLKKEHRVVLVDREEAHIFWPSLLWLQVGLRERSGIVRELSKLRKKGIEVICREVEAIAPAEMTVTIDGHTLEFDYLVVSLGAQLEKIPELAEAGHNLYTLDGAAAICDTRNSLTQGHLVVVAAGTPFKCPAAPYEAAMLLEHDLRKRQVRDRVTVALYSPETGPGVPEVSAGVRSMVEAKGISYFPEHRLEQVEPLDRTLHFSNGTEAQFDFLVYIPPHVPPQVVLDGGLGGDSGWVQVDRETMETAFPDVFAIGDVTTIGLSMGLPLPKAGVFAHHQAEAVAHSIASRIDGAPEFSTFNGHGECFVEAGGGPGRLWQRELLRRTHADHQIARARQAMARSQGCFSKKIG